MLQHPPRSWWLVLAALMLGLGGGLAAVVLSHGRPRSAPAAESLVPAAVRVVPPTTSPPRLVVDVAGAVARPGIYDLPPGARVADAVAAAGGPRGEADTSRLNLAAPIADGSRVYLPLPGETPPAVVGPWPASGADGSGRSSPGDDAQPVDLNTATEQQLEDLPGVGPATAAAIVRRREEHPFASVDDLLAVTGIGPAKLETLRPHVRV